MLCKVLSIAVLCFLALCAGCSESNPVASEACQAELAEKDSIIAAQEGQITALAQEKQAAVDSIVSLQRQIESEKRKIDSQEEQIDSQEGQIDALEDGLSARENAPQFQTIVKGRINIRAGNYSSTAFSVKSHMRNVRLQGDFREVAGTALYVVVFDDLNFRNWAAGGDSKALYNSGKVVVGEIDLPIRAAGTYHLVFSNTHSWITQKNVEATVDLWFEM